MKNKKIAKINFKLYSYFRKPEPKRKEKTVTITIEQQEELGEVVNDWLKRRSCINGEEEKVIISLRVMAVRNFCINDNSDNSLETGRLLDITIEDLGLESRAFNALKKANVPDARAIIQRGYRGLIVIRNFGKKSFRNVRRCLQNIGIKLGPGWKIPGESNDFWKPDFEF